MNLPRRKFLESSLLFGASAALVLVSGRLGMAQTASLDDGGIPIEAQQDPVYRFSIETFQPYVGGYFQAPNTRGELIALKLLEAKAYTPSRKTRITISEKDTESFSLLFSADQPLTPFTSIHRIKHGALGDFNLSLIPRAGKKNQYLYEATFNRVR